MYQTIVIIHVHNITIVVWMHELVVVSLKKGTSISVNLSTVFRYKTSKTPG